MRFKPVNENLFCFRIFAVNNLFFQNIMIAYDKDGLKLKKHPYFNSPKILTFLYTPRLLIQSISSPAVCALCRIFRHTPLHQIFL